MEDFTITLEKSCLGDQVLVTASYKYIFYMFQNMADQDLRELLTEFKNMAESEHHSFLNTIVNNFSHANTIFGALILFEVRTCCL